TDPPITIHFQSKAAFSTGGAAPPAPGISAASLAVLGLAVVVMVSAPVVVMVAFTVLVRVILMAAACFWDARILVEDERLDRDRDGEGRHAHAAEIDIVEV